MNKVTRRAYLGGMVAILLLAAAMRLYLLTADPPIYLTRSQELNTDGPNTIGPGRDWVLFGVQPPPSVQPALTWLAYLSFSLLGTGYWQANFMAVVSGLFAIVFIAAFARQNFGRRVALFSAFLMALNFPYLIYNRTPMVYTPLTCALALALYCWGRGLRRSVWFLGSGWVALFSIFYIKVAGVTFLAAAIAGLLILTWRRWPQQQFTAVIPLILFSLGGALMAGVAWLHLFKVIPVQAILPSEVAMRTFNAELGLEENIRFAVVSILQFGIYSGFFARLFPLFALVYGYLFYQGIQLLGKNPPALKLSEIIALLFLFSTVLLLLASNNLPYRFMIALIPPMSLIAGLALDAWLRLERIRLPAQLGRFQLIFILMGLTYFIYQFLAAVLKVGNTLRLDTHLVDYRVIIDLGTLYALLIVALFLAMGGILIYLNWMGRTGRANLTLPPPAIRGQIALLLIIVIVGIDVYHYGAWAREPQFSIVAASRQMGQELSKNAILGGSYAYVLTLENELPAVAFYTTGYAGLGEIDPKITHLVVDADSLLKDAPFNEQMMIERFPEVMKRAKLLKSYWLRGYLIKLYEIEQ